MINGTTRPSTQACDGPCFGELYGGGHARLGRIWPELCNDLGFGLLNRFVKIPERFAQGPLCHLGGVPKVQYFLLLLPFDALQKRLLNGRVAQIAHFIGAKWKETKIC